MLKLLLLNVSSLRLNAEKVHYLKSKHPYKKFVSARQTIAIIISAICAISIVIFSMLTRVFNLEYFLLLKIAVSCFVYLLLWLVFEWLFSKHSIVKIYRVRRLLQRITVELSNMNKQVQDMPFHAVGFEFWIKNEQVFIRCYTSGFLRNDNSVQQIPLVIQNYIIADSSNKSDGWTLLDESNNEGFIEMKFGSLPTRIEYKEDFFR